jgi:predicted homoserine dehydrogenase-like protein
VILVDSALQARAADNKSIRVGMVGAGFMGRGVANQIVNSTPGMDLVAIANRHVKTAQRAYTEAGVTESRLVDDGAGIDKAIAAGVPAVTENHLAICEADGVDVVLEVTGTVDLAARVTVAAIGAGKHIVLMSAEMDGTLGPILKVRADQAGVIYTGVDGDQPGVEMNLVRFVRGIGLTALLCGNIKGLQDPYRNPTTQEAFARRWGQNPWMVTSFADGTKVSFEQALVANAAGMQVARRGMHGLNFDGHVDQLTDRYDIDELRAAGGIVDYVVGTKPGPGIFVLGTHDDPKQRHYLDLYKLGTGPLYSFYAPYHLCHFEVPTTIARAALFGDAAIAPLGGPRVEVVTTAKVDILAGTTIDAFGGYLSYGQAENSAETRSERLLPMGLAEGCVLRHDVRKDHVITYDDVEVPPDRFIDTLREEQDARFPA